MQNESGEAQARRAAKRVGLCAKKSRFRLGSADNYGKFTLIDPCRNATVAGERFSLDVEDVIAICERYAPVR